jgi:predicted negative regulator of RcsB-dependent stress response
MSKKNVEVDIEEFNPAAKILEDLIIGWKKHKNIFATILVVAIVAVASYSSYSYVQEQKITDAAKAYGALSLTSQNDKLEAQKALESIVNDHSGTEYAIYSSYLLAQQYLTDEKYDEAIAGFDKTIANSTQKNFIVAESYEGKAIALEAKGDNSEAIKFYKKVISLKEGLHRRSAVQYKLALLLKKEGEASSALELCSVIQADTLASDKLKISAQNLEVTINVAK